MQSSPEQRQRGGVGEKGVVAEGQLAVSVGAELGVGEGVRIGE